MRKRPTRTRRARAGWEASCAGWRARCHACSTRAPYPCHTPLPGLHLWPLPRPCNQVLLNVAREKPAGLAPKLAAVLWEELLDVAGGTASWLPPLPLPARELLLHALRGAAAEVAGLEQAVGRLCTRGAAGGLVALRHEEWRLQQASCLPPHLPRHQQLVLLLRRRRRRRLFRLLLVLLLHHLLLSLSSSAVLLRLLPPLSPQPPPRRRPAARWAAARCWRR